MNKHIINRMKGQRQKHQYKTRKIRKQRAGGTRQMTARLYNEDNQRVYLHTLDPDRVNAISMAIRYFLSSRFASENSFVLKSPEDSLGNEARPDYIITYGEFARNNTINMRFTPKNFPPRAPFFMERNELPFNIGGQLFIVRFSSR